MSNLTPVRIQKKSYTRANGTTVKAHAATTRKNLTPVASSIKGPAAGPVTKAPRPTSALGLGLTEPETAVEFRARYDAELAAAETPEEWRAVAQQNEVNEGRHFRGELAAADVLFARQQARGLAFAQLFLEKFGDPRKAEETRTSEEAKAAYTQMKNEKALAWRGHTAIADRARLVATGMLDEDDAEDADRETHIALAAAAARPDNTAEQLAEYAKIDSDWVVDEVVRHPNTSTPTLVGLAGRDPVASLTAARRSDAPPEFLADQAGSSYPNIRAAVAGHPSTPAATLRELSRDDDRDVQTALATNPATPVSALKRLSDRSGSATSTAAWRRLRDRNA